MPDDSNPDAITPYPLVLTPIFKPKVWGGRGLEKLGKSLPDSQDGMTTFGESWELADLASTSVSGGGGGEARSIIANGPLAGKTLNDAINLWGDGLIERSKLVGNPSGTHVSGGTGFQPVGFPLLVKYLDAREHLSVQTHPSPAYAAANAGVSGINLKTESWVVLSAEPGAELFLGVKPGVDLDELRARIANNTLPEVLVRVPAQLGACYTLPSGTIHALGAGIVVAEVQTPSDTTYRLYDWTAEYNRPERELHIEQGLQACVLDAPPEPGLLECDPGQSARGVVAKTDHYTIERVIASCEEVELPAGCCVVMVTKTMGAGIASKGGGAFEEIMVAAGQTVLVPEACGGEGEVGVLRAGPMTEALIITLS